MHGLNLHRKASIPPGWKVVEGFRNYIARETSEVSFDSSSVPAALPPDSQIFFVKAKWKKDFELGMTLVMLFTLFYTFVIVYV